MGSGGNPRFLSLSFVSGRTAPLQTSVARVPKDAPAPAPSCLSQLSLANPSVSSLPPHCFSAHLCPFPLLENGEQTISFIGQGREGWLAIGIVSSSKTSKKMEERGGKTKPKGRKDSWGVVTDRLRVGCRDREDSRWDRADRRELSKPPSRRLGSSPQLWD